MPLTRAQAAGKARWWLRTNGYRKLARQLPNGRDQPDRPAWFDFRCWEIRLPCGTRQVIVVFDNGTVYPFTR